MSTTRHEPPPAVPAGRGPARPLRAPTAVEWIQRVADVSDPVRALEEWNRAAMATGHLGMHLGPEELGRIAQWIVDHCTDQPVRMAARSCLVHLHVHAVLARG